VTTPANERGLRVLAFPYLVGLVLLVGLPAILTVQLAFTNADLIGPSSSVGTENFRELAGDESFRNSLRNSLVYVLGAVPLRLAGALGLALLLHRRFRAVGVYRSSVYLPTVVPSLAYALVWLWLFNPLYGPLNTALAALGLPTPDWRTDADWAMAGVILMSLFVLGEGFLVAMATRQEIPDELEELAAIEGSSTWSMFRRITLPLMAPTLLLLVVRDIAFSLQASFVPALIVTGGGPPRESTTFLPLFIYREGFEFLRFGYAAAATMVMFAVTAVLTLVLWRVGRRWRESFLV
jgi:multiple sugar transport system permease protein